MHYNGPPHHITHLVGTPIWRYDPIAVQMINHLSQKYEAWIVYNSSHNAIEIKDPGYLMHQSCLNGLIRIHDEIYTDYPDKTNYRAQGIENWLRAHPDVKNWVCVDDFLVATPNFVRVNFMTGIGLDEYEQIEYYLKG